MASSEQIEGITEGLGEELKQMFKLRRTKISEKGWSGPLFPHVRIKVWDGEKFLDHSGSNSHSQPFGNTAFLREIAEQRNKKVKVADGKGWTGKVTWVHINGNDMLTCQAVLYFLAGHPKEQYEVLSSKRYWLDQLDVPWNMLPPSQPTMAEASNAWKDKPVEASFMDATAFNIGFNVDEHGFWTPSPSQQISEEERASSPFAETRKQILSLAKQLRHYESIEKASRGHHPEDNPPQDEDNEKEDEVPRIVSSTVLYMPYLHYAALDQHNQELEWRQRGAADWAYHPRRSLDEAANRFFTYTTLAERNNDQVVTRFLRDVQKKSGTRGRRSVKDGLTLMVVDQLWLWILDKDTLVTGFPGGYCENPRDRCPALHLGCLALEQAKMSCQDGLLDAERLASCLIQRSYQVLTHRSVRHPNLRYIDIFERSISEQRAKSTDLFRALEMKKKPGSSLTTRSPESHTSKSAKGASKEGESSRETRRRRSKDVFNLQEDIVAVGQVRDIHEELHIMRRIVDLQISALESTGLCDWPMWQKELKRFKGQLEGLCEQTKEINELLVQTLELKQAQLSVRQNQISMRQNQIVLLFTIITIIFLPLGFISSIFGMNATELSDGSPVGLRRIFTYMVPISAVISGIALGIAFRSNIADFFGRTNTQEENHEERKMENKPMV